MEGWLLAVTCMRVGQRAKTHYGFDFASVISQENIMGAQFHPEKSHKFGMALLKNFAECV